MDKKLYTRRIFIGKCLGITALATGAVVVSGCNNPGSANKGQKAKDGNGKCDDLSQLSKAEIEKRKKFGYVEESTVPGSHCGNCALYVPATAPGHCGSCLLFNGPVDATGYCTQYVAKS